MVKLQSLPDSKYTKLFFLLFILIFTENISAQEISKDRIKEMTVHIQGIAPSNPDSALVMVDKYLNEFHDDYAQAELYLQQSMAYGFIGRRKDALISAIRAKEFSYRSKDYSQRARICGLTANRYRDIDLTSKAKEYLKQGLLSAENIPDTNERNRVTSMLFTEYSKNFTEEKKYDSASIYYMKSLQALSRLEQSEKVRFQLAVTHLGLGTSYLLDKKWDSAEIHFNKTIEFANNGQWKDYHISSAKLYTSAIYTQRSQYQKAVATLLEAERIIQHDDPKMSELYYYLSQNYLKLNDNENFQKYNNLYLSTKSKLSEENLAAINETLLILDNILQDESNRKEFNRNLAIFVAVISFLLIGGLIIYYKRKQKINKRLFQDIILKLENNISEEKTRENSESSIDFLEENSSTSDVYLAFNEAKKEVRKSYGIPRTIEEELLNKLHKFEASEKFINAKLSLSVLASQLGTNTNYLSGVINSRKGKNYNSYINELRIEYICKKIIKNPEYRNYKISYLAEACGFSSYAYFTTTFKAHTGMTPLQFLKEAAKSV